MTVKLLVDMNLSPDWVPVLKSHGWSVVHWSTIGDPRASDRTIMEWAAKHEYVVLTHDLDFGAMLALSHAAGPSVLQVRAGDILPDRLEGSVIAALKQNDADLLGWALARAVAGTRDIASAGLSSVIHKYLSGRLTENR